MNLAFKIDSTSILSYALMHVCGSCLAYIFNDRISERPQM